VIWPAWIIVNLAVIAATWGRDPRPAILSLAGLVAMRFMGAVPVEIDLLIRAFIWFAIGYVVAFFYRRVLSGGLIVASGLCYLWARLTGAEMAFLSPPFVVSDLLWLAAVLWLAIGKTDGIGSRGHSLGGIARRYRHSGYHSGMAARETQKGQ
jgi:hypothetical protein